MLEAVPAFPASVAEFLSDHHGVATRQQLASLAPSGAAQVDGWVRSRHLRRLYRGVLVAAGCPATPHQNVYAAVLRCGHGARAGGRSSLGLLEVEGFDLASRIPVDTVVPRPREVTGVSFTVRATTVPPCDRTTVGGIPALSASRALIEVAHLVDDRTLRVALDSARRLRLLSISLLTSRAAAFRNHPGAAVVRRLLALDTAAAESEGERALLPLLADFDPPPELQVTDLVPGRRLDFAWRFIRYALEYDGRDHHVLPTDRDADGLRDLACAEAGVLVHRITAGMLRESTEATFRGIRATFERRKRHFAALA